MGTKYVVSKRWFIAFTSTALTEIQCDPMRRIFAFWANFYFGKFWHFHQWPKLMNFFLHRSSSYIKNVDKILVRLHFMQILLQTHLVTLLKFYPYVVSSWAGWPDWSIFHHLGDCYLTFGIFCNIWISSPKLLCFVFHRKKVMYQFWRKLGCWHDDEIGRIFTLCIGGCILGAL
jgi:hypothetical protein